MQFIFLLTVLFSSFSLCAQEGGATDETTIVAVGEAELESEKIYFSFDSSSSENVLAREYGNNLRSLFNNDFTFYKKLFSVSSPKEKWDKKYASVNSLNKTFWASQNYAYVGKLRVSKKSEEGFNVIFNGHEVASGDSIYKWEGELNLEDPRATGHKIAAGFYQAITGETPIFETHMVFVSDRGSTQKRVVKELYHMDFDGENVQRLTHHKGTVISPAISNDGTKVLYSLIRHKKGKKNINLYMLDLTTDKTSLISARKGINSGAVFHPDGDKILLTLSHTGNAELYTLDLKTRKLRRLTRHYAPDVDPSITRDGDLVTFLSGRPGKAMIYTLDPQGLEKEVTRISFVGKFNATPRFSPNGKHIAFSSWLDNRFDIFRINPDGSGLARLTKDFGSNEDPTYSNDGNFIAFSSQRVISIKEAVQNIYIMDKDGEIIGQITRNFGNCITPRWSKSL